MSTSSESWTRRCLPPAFSDVLPLEYRLAPLICPVFRVSWGRSRVIGYRWPAYRRKRQRSPFLAERRVFLGVPSRSNNAARQVLPRRRFGPWVGWWWRYFAIRYVRSPEALLVDSIL
jgi:hypothetical protein